MSIVYLWLNAIIYLVFGLLCTLNLDKITAAQGFLKLDNNGRCEYLAVYGGMEIGFAIFYALCALKPAYRSAGILFSLCLYGGICTWRLTSLMFLSDISITTKSIAVLEVALLIGAALLFKTSIE
ncbi:MAG: hypothetical protein WCT04_11735 [Planctomycetota bacterium]